MAVPSPRAKPSSLKNLGAATDAMLLRVGIETADAVRDLGAPMIYKMLSHRLGHPAHLLVLYALAGAVEDRHWNSFTPDEKAALRAAVADDLAVR